ncbi:FAD-dependent oxidoreductase [Actinocrispum wychmicini]|uniref:Bifunctional hydroxylase/dehydrase n=1 Tax=Actinocrispum wychmicini TaxID=1213861 RepID=A0A4R2JU55_9PSEU|nr:FAD-dependent oxidoreductase [Actinocrispum wychmicini]TCO60796.1 bifunctional hydroxylase/dehydrase [Actinocrispum wychmicini]
MTHPLAIAGAGPVGLTLAGELAAAGVETVVLERLPEPRTQSLGMAVNPTVVELLTQRGLMDGLRGSGFEFPQAFFAHFRLDPTKLTEPRAYNWALPHAALEHRLAEHAESLGVKIRRGAEVVAVEQADNGVRVDIRTANGPETLHCRYLVGCDGADSAVRKLAGIDFPGADSPFYGLIAELIPNDGLRRLLGPHIYDGGLVTVSPSGPATVRVTTAEFGVEPPDAKAPVTRAELAAHIERISGEPCEIGDALWLTRWFHVTRQAETYRRGDIFLAGDSAHVHFPLGGQALSTGIEDAVNLGWKLAAVLRHDADPALLDTYEAERYAVGTRSCRSTEAQIALMHPMSAVAPLRELFGELLTFDEVNNHLVKLAGGLDVTYPADPGAHPLVGTRLPQPPLNPGKGVLLDRTGLAADPEWARWADRVDVVTAAPETLLGATAVLVRPDGRVAWATDGTDVTGLRPALEKWFSPAGSL